MNRVEKVQFYFYQPFVYLLFGLLSTKCFAIEIDSSFVKYADSIFLNYETPLHTEVKTKEAERTQFLAFTVKTFRHPFSEVAYLLRHPEEYASKSKKLKQAELVDSTRLDTSTWFMVYGNWLVGSWTIGDIFESKNSTEDEIYMINNKNDNSDLNHTYEPKVTGWMKIGYFDFCMWTRIKKMNDTLTRVATYSIVEPTSKIPVWLNKIATKKIFPGILNEVDDILSVEIKY